MNGARLLLALLGLLLGSSPSLAESRPWAEITVSCAQGSAQVWVDGRHLGQTPLTLEAEPGRYTVRVLLEGFPPFERSLTLAPGQVARLEAPLTRPPSPTARLLYLDSTDRAGLQRRWPALKRGSRALEGPTWSSPPSRGWIALAARSLERCPPGQAEAAGQRLSRSLRQAVLLVELSGQGEVRYLFWDRGLLRDRYRSNPGPEATRTWAGRPEELLRVSRGRPLSALRTQVSLTDLHALLYFYPPELKATRPEAWRAPSEVARLLASLLGLPTPPRPLEELHGLPGWTRL